MKTSVEIDEKRVKLAKQLTNCTTLKALIEKALDSVIAQARRQQMLGILGKDFFQGNLQEMRERRGRSSR